MITLQYVFNLFLNMLKSASSLANLMGAVPQRPLLTSRTGTTQIFECVQRILRRTVSWFWEREANDVNTINGCEHNEVG